MNAPTPTRTRILDAALASFSSRGFEATALDGLASSLGLTKQTILHHFGSKDLLLSAVLERTVADLAHAIDGQLEKAPVGWPALEAVVAAVFRLVSRRPELLGLLREVGRLDTHSSQLALALAPLTNRATAFLQSDLVSSNATDIRAIVVSAYAAVIGAVTEFDTLRQLGSPPSARLVVRRRRELLVYLSDLLGVKPNDEPRP